MKLRNAAGATVSNELKSVAGACERPTKRARLMCQRKESSTTPSSTAFLAPMAERVDFESCFEPLDLGN